MDKKQSSLNMWDKMSDTQLDLCTIIVKGILLIFNGYFLIKSIISFKYMVPAMVLNSISRKVDFKKLQSSYKKENKDVGE